MTPRTVARQALLSLGFSRQEYCSGMPFPPPGGLPESGIKPASPISPAFAGRFFTTSATWGGYLTKENSQFLPPILMACCRSFCLHICYNNLIHCYYYYFKQLLLRSIKNKNTFFTFIPPSMLFLFLKCRYKFLAYIIFLHLRKSFNLSCETGDGFPQFMFIWVNLSFSFSFEE